MIPDAGIARLLMQLLRDDGSAGEVTLADGRRYRRRAAPEPGVRMSLEHVAPDGSTRRAIDFYDPATARPASYPAELPFVATLPSIVVRELATMPPSMMVTWGELREVDTLERMIVDGSRAEGWEVAAEPRAFAGGLASPWELRRGAAKRYLSIVDFPTGRAAMVLQTA